MRTYSGHWNQDQRNKNKMRRPSYIFILVPIAFVLLMLFITNPFTGRGTAAAAGIDRLRFYYALRDDGGIGSGEMIFDFNLVSGADIIRAFEMAFGRPPLHALASVGPNVEILQIIAHGDAVEIVFSTYPFGHLDTEERKNSAGQAIALTLLEFYNTANVVYLIADNEWVAIFTRDFLRQQLIN